MPQTVIAQQSLLETAENTVDVSKMRVHIIEKGAGCQDATAKVYIHLR